MGFIMTKVIVARRLSTTLLLILALAGAKAAPASKVKECQKVRLQIEKIQNKMRQGYNQKQGAKYNKQLNELYKKEFKSCA